jgi:hypothetical protein
MVALVSARIDSHYRRTISKTIFKVNKDLKQYSFLYYFFRRELVETLSLEQLENLGEALPG